MKHMKSLFSFVLIVAAMVLTQSCVHEFPELSDTVRVRLKVTHDLNWTSLDYYINENSKSRDSKAAEEGWTARYILKLYPRGEQKIPVRVYTINRDDITLADFEMDVMMPAGEWDIYVWQDFTNPNEVPPYYETGNFEAVTYAKPYRGDTDMRDAYEGFISLDVPKTMEANYVKTGELEMSRPFARYVFIATDFEKFYNESLSRYNMPMGKPSRWDALSEAQKQEALKGFSVLAKYPWYMPAVYNMFTQKVIDSWTNMYYEAEIRPLSSQEAAVAMDYVMINHLESAAQVQLGLKVPDGSIIGLTSTISVPLKRGQTTYVRGDFLTASAGSGLSIDFSFSGDFNIQIP